MEFLKRFFLCANSKELILAAKIMVKTGSARWIVVLRNQQIPLVRSWDDED